MQLSTGGEELRQLIEGSRRGFDPKERRNASDVLKERPDLIEYLDEYLQYRENIAHTDATPATAHSMATAISQMRQSTPK